MIGSGEPADFVFETHRVVPVKDTPVAHDSFTSPFQEGMSRKTVALVPVDAGVGGEQVPKVVVAPKGKRQHMIHIESPAESSACPDTYCSRIRMPRSRPEPVPMSRISEPGGNAALKYFAGPLADTV